MAMWKRPRLVAWFLLVSASVVAVRLPFRGMEMVPGCIELFPGIVLIPAAGIYCGPAGVLGVAAGAAIFDVFFGSWGILAGIRAAAFAIGAFVAARLVSSAVPSGPDGQPRRKRRVVMIALAGSAAGCTVAAWQGLAGAWAGLYPFAYVAALRLANHLLFILLFAPFVVRVAETHWVPVVGEWRAVLEGPAAAEGSGPGWATVLLWTGGAAACLYGFASSGWIDGVWPVERAPIGVRTSAWITVPAATILVAQAAALWPLRAAPEVSEGTAGASTRFRGLLLSPIEKT